MELASSTRRSTAIPHLLQFLKTKGAARRKAQLQQQPLRHLRLPLRCTPESSFASLLRSPHHGIIQKYSASGTSRNPPPTSLPKRKPIPSQPSRQNLPPSQTQTQLRTQTQRQPKQPPNPPMFAPASERSPKIFIWGSSIFAVVTALYLSFLYTSYNAMVAKTSRINLPQDSDVSDRWNDLSRDYDDEVNFSERLMFLKSKRKKLVNEAYGNVLEVSVGTGRNMDLYDLRPYDVDENSRTGRSRRRLIRSLTFNDQSEFMVAQAERKFEEMENSRPKIARFQGPVNFVVGDAGIKGVIKRPKGGYDTIVQTMGVCSVSDPVSFLKTLGALCRQPGEASQWPVAETDADDDDLGGKILLLEHGKSHYDFVNGVLDNGAKMHAIHYGCWWNKDIGKVIKDSGLVVERVKRYHAGTTWEIVLRPAKKDKL